VTSAKNAGRDALCEVLLNYLQRISCFVPGGDSMTIEDILNLYDSALERGQVPNRERLLRLHPDLTERIEFFFAPSIRKL